MRIRNKGVNGVLAHGDQEIDDKKVVNFAVPDLSLRCTLFSGIFGVLLR
jgi:hypothetical protein